MSQKARYKNQKELGTRKVFFTLIAILALILLFCIILVSSLDAKKNEKEQLMITGRFNSVKDILEYYGCKYKGEKNSKPEEFVTDIYAVLKYELYDGEKSNEKFYNNLINEIAKFLNYKNFQLIDETKEEKIEIQVFCVNGKIDTIIINGIEDYFIYMDSRISLSKYKEIKTTDILIQAPEILNCIQNNWNSNIEFGTRESIFQNYYIYFDEGIKTRKIDGKIYNIVFTKKYVNSVVNGFTVGTENDIIIRGLGNPTFKNDDGSIIGYKGKDIYVFFEKDQISIYRNIKENGYDEFFDLVDDFLDEKYTLLEFMNELTYTWPDYEEYTYDTQTVFLSYPNKGIDVKINYDNTDGIVLYNNIGINQKNIDKYSKHTEFVAQLQVDNIFNAEKRRYENEKNFATKCKEYKEENEKEDNRNRGKCYNYYADLDSNSNILSMYFISQVPDFVNCELKESIDSYIWLNEYCFAYSKTGKGIYYYDLKNQVKGVILTGEEEYKIEAYENNVLKYDDKEIAIQF